VSAQQLGPFYFIVGVPLGFRQAVESNPRLARNCGVRTRSAGTTPDSSESVRVRMMVVTVMAPRRVVSLYSRSARGWRSAPRRPC
jgi:hypothetical protein